MSSDAGQEVWIQTFTQHSQRQTLHWCSPQLLRVVLWERVVFLGHSLSNAVIFLPNVWIPSECRCLWSLFSNFFLLEFAFFFGFLPSSANSCTSVAIIHLGFTWFHVNNAPEEDNPFIPVRNQSIHTSVSSFSSPVPCRLLDRSLRKPRMTRNESKCARRFKTSIITPNPYRTMGMMLNSHLFFLLTFLSFNIFINTSTNGIKVHDCWGCCLCGTRTHVESNNSDDVNIPQKWFRISQSAALITQRDPPNQQWY